MQTTQFVVSFLHVCVPHNFQMSDNIDRSSDLCASPNVHQYLHMSPSSHQSTPEPDVILIVSSVGWQLENWILQSLKKIL